MRLYGYWRSSATWRVRIGLRIKGVAHEVVPVHLIRDGGEHRLPAHLARNPMGQVPVLELVVDGQVVHLTQSLAILGYLEQVAPTPALLPADPIRRAQAWAMAEVVNSGIQPLQNLTVGRRVSALGGDATAWNREVIAEGLAALERLAAAAPGPFLGGEAPSIADCCLVPQLYNARRFDVDVRGLGRLLEAEAACVALPAFQAAHPDAQPDAQPS